jgi:hypothetical protein
MLKANPAIGITTDTVIATASAAAGSWGQISGTTAAASDDGVFEFVVDCDGTTGWTNVDDWSDNVTLPATSGTVLADEVTDSVLGTGVVQMFKMMDGAINGTNKASLSGPGFLRVTDEPHQLFYDPFDGIVLDTTARWTASYGLGAALIPSQVSGQLTIDAGATSTGWSSLESKASFVPTIPAWFGVSFAINLTDGASLVSSGYRFWGVGTVPATPTVASPLSDAVGFEVTGGKMYAVVYANGVRTEIQDMSAATGNSTAPTNTSNHRYIIFIRTDRTYFFVDTLGTEVASSSFQSPTVQTLPIRFLSISGGAATTIQSPGIAAWDTGKNNTQLSDATYPWRKTTVSSAGALKVDASATTQPVSVVTDYSSVRAQELALLVGQANLVEAVLSTERSSSGNYGFELR